jgi:hypothetical protein
MQRYLLIIALLIEPLAHAELVDHKHYTTDTETGLDWLDLIQTAGRSVDQVVTLGAGGFTEDGWR